MKPPTSTLLGLAGSVLVALAMIPAPGRGQGIIIPPCVDMPEAIVITPDGSIPFTVTLTDARTTCTVPFVGVFVELEFSPEADALIVWAPGQAHPVLSGYTDSDGQVTFHIAGAGCLDPGRFQAAPYVAQLRGDDIPLAELQVVTGPDVVNSEGLLPTELGTTICENGKSTVGLSDAVFHTNSIKNGLVEPCSKVTGSPQDPVNLDDAVVLTPYIKGGGSITCGP